MQIRLLLGPAGSGKTFRCLAEIRHQLISSPGGTPLLLVAPKQTTYQLERQLLVDPVLPGYVRLHILSFERLARFIFQQLNRTPPRLLDEEGRLMVLRSLLAKKRTDLRLFRASARLTGFAQQLSLALRELQRNQLTPEALHQLGLQVRHSEGLSFKLHDLAVLLRDYLAWLEAQGLQDADSLLPVAARALKPGDAETQTITPNPSLCFSGLWLDGFAELSEQELDLLAALMPCCQHATVTFCLDQAPQNHSSWLSSWSVVRRTFEKCRQKFSSLANSELHSEILPRDPLRTRFVKNPVLRHLECCWARPEPYRNPDLEVASRVAPSAGLKSLSRTLRVVFCADPEAEATLAAREILCYLRNGGRYRDVMVLVRNLGGYHPVLQRVFSRYEIPLFLDRRESVSHHPLAELTRGALRTVAFQWQPEDWFAALKTGLVPVDEVDIDRLENEALARGWRGAIWQNPIVVQDDPDLNSWLSGLYTRLLPAFHNLALDLALSQNRPTGLELAAALRQFWSRLRVEQTLADWAATEISTSIFRVSGSVHTTVWSQMNAWVRNIELAFPTAPLSLREWLPILEAGLSNLSVGVIPPALDQVLAGTLDRSRNPDVKFALVLGLNETVFPSAPETNVLLTESERAELGKLNANFGSATQQHLARERYLAYVACTRARERLVLTCSFADRHGTPLNPSPFLSHLRQLFPSLEFETHPTILDWRASEHLNELIAPILRMEKASSRPAVGGPPSGMAAHKAAVNVPGIDLDIPAGLSSILAHMRRLVTPELEEQLAPDLARRLYGTVLRTSVSRMEQFAACPFKFFIHSGLRAQERTHFELDIKEQGTFQHDVLAIFHEVLRAENLRWRDISPEEARARVGAIAKGLLTSYREGLLEASEETRFLARVLTESLQDFVETLVCWMREQYLFDPVAVEFPFGEDEDSGPWAIDLPNGCRLELRGRIDRIDLFKEEGAEDALCVVIDYKSSEKQLDPLLVEHGLQLQLLTYLNVLRHWPNARKIFGVRRLIPAGVFYVNLRGKYERATNRIDALTDPLKARKQAYRHAGRFDLRALKRLDSRPEAKQGDQFNYRLTGTKALYRNSHEALTTPRFEALLGSVEANLKKMGNLVYAGQAEVSPYKKGSAIACQQCDYASICRIDPWTHQYRVPRKEMRHSSNPD